MQQIAGLTRTPVPGTFENPVFRIPDPAPEMAAFHAEMAAAMAPVDEAILAGKRRVYRAMEAAILLACATFGIADIRSRPTDELTLLLRQQPGTLERVGSRYELRYHYLEGIQEGDLVAWGTEETIFKDETFTIETAFDFTPWFRGEREKRGLGAPPAMCNGD